MNIGKHMYKIIVNIIRLQTLELFVKIFVHIRTFFYEIMGELGCHIDLIAIAFGK